jgi:tripartite-type tricarboxylate transporter receptor subunit TctC
MKERVWGRLSRRAMARSALAALALYAYPTMAETKYPDRPIKLVVGYPAGGSGDITGRIVADMLSRYLGASVVVENIGGAGGSIAAHRVASSEPDGYTLMVAANNETLINNLVNDKLKYNGLNDMTHIGLVNHQPIAFVASKKTGTKTIDEFVKAAKAQPDKFSYGTSGVGTSFHIVGELINQKAGISMVHVPYRGAAPLATDLLGGQLDFGVVVLASALPSIRNGSMIAIGTTEAKRAKSTPDVPALTEHPLFKDVDIGNWYVLCGPKGLPDEIVSRVRAALQAGLADPEFIKRLEASGSEAFTGKEDVKEFLIKEQKKYKGIVESAKIKS